MNVLHNLKISSVLFIYYNCVISCPCIFGNIPFAETCNADRYGRMGFSYHFVNVICHQQ